MKATKLFLGCEFTGLTKTTTLISIGLVSECGKTFYAELTDYDKSKIDDWLKKNVIDNLILNEEEHGDKECFSFNHCKYCGNKFEVKKILFKWLSQFESVEVWCDCLSCDWAVFSEIFGNTLNLPDNVYYIPFDLCTLFKIKGFEADIDREEFANIKNKPKKHNSLFDAKVIKECYFKLMKIK